MTQRKQIYQGKIVDLGLETVQIAAGKPPAVLEIVRHPGGAAVAAIDANNQICLLKQYRHAVGQWLWELPAGKIDNQEPPDTTIKRELQEEAGVIARNWQSLGEIVSSPGILDEVLYLYLARNLTIKQSQHELHEYIEVHWIDFDQAIAMAYNNDIIDAKSIITMLRANHVLQHA